MGKLPDLPNINAEQLQTPTVELLAASAAHSDAVRLAARALVQPFQKMLGNDAAYWGARSPSLI